MEIKARPGTRKRQPLASVRSRKMQDTWNRVHGGNSEEIHRLIVMSMDVPKEHIDV